MAKTKKTEQPKQFSLTQTEINNIAFRRTVVDYAINAFNNEMGQYIYTEVRPRLNLPEHIAVELSEDGKTIIVIEDKPKEQGVITGGK